MTLPHITPKQEEILKQLYRFRFLNRPQIQQLITCPDLKRINTWLKDLYDKNYAGKIIDTTSKINSIPHIYFIGVNGIRYLKTQDKYPKPYFKKLYSESKKRQVFIQRCIFIADVYIGLFKSHGANVNFYTQSDFTPEGLIKGLMPSFVFRKTEEAHYTVCEIFAENMPRFAIRARITKHLTFFTDSDWTNNEPPPKIIFFCPNMKLKRFVEWFSAKYMNEEGVENMQVVAVLKDDITEKGIDVITANLNEDKSL